MSSSDRTDRFDGYARARVVFDDLAGERLVVRPRPEGTRGTFPDVAAPVYVITAHDPGPQRLPAVENRRRQDALVAELEARGLRVTRAVGGDDDGGYAEVSAVVAGWDDDEAVALGRRHGQDAIFRWTPGAWEIVACDGGPTVTLGWTVERP